MRFPRYISLPLILLILGGNIKISAAEHTDSISSRNAASIVIGAGSTVVVNAVLTETLKASIHEMRPNRSDNHSWPSRHTSWAFAAAAVVSRELGFRSPWWTVGAQTLASAVGWQRTLSHNHYPKDVMGGAAIGLTSASIGYLVESLVMPGSRSSLPYASDSWRPALWSSTSAVFPLGGAGHGFSARSAYEMEIGATLPLGEWWGVGLRAYGGSLPLYFADQYSCMLQHADLALAFDTHTSISGRWGADAAAVIGAARNWGADDADMPSASFVLRLEAGTSFALSPRWAMNLKAGYSLRTIAGPLSALSLSLGSMIRF